MMPPEAAAVFATVVRPATRDMVVLLQLREVRLDGLFGPSGIDPTLMVSHHLIISERADASEEVIERHDSEMTEKDKMEARRQYPDDEFAGADDYLIDAPSGHTSSNRVESTEHGRLCCSSVDIVTKAYRLLVIADNFDRLQSKLHDGDILTLLRGRFSTTNNKWA